LFLEKMTRLFVRFCDILILKVYIRNTLIFIKFEASCPTVVLVY
jgi:hypothetical protein